MKDREYLYILMTWCFSCYSPRAQLKEQLNDNATGLSAMVFPVNSLSFGSLAIARLEVTDWGRLWATRRCGEIAGRHPLGRQAQG